MFILGLKRYLYTLGVEEKTASLFKIFEEKKMSHDMRFPTMWYVRPVCTTSKASDQPAHMRSAHAQSDQSLC